VRRFQRDENNRLKENREARSKNQEHQRLHKQSLIGKERQTPKKAF